jgi:hypothetical protein
VLLPPIFAQLIEKLCANAPEAEARSHPPTQSATAKLRQATPRRARLRKTEIRRQPVLRDSAAEGERGVSAKMSAEIFIALIVLNAGTQPNHQPKPMPGCSRFVS